MHDSTIPAELLELKARFEAWRANRKSQREPTPAELRQAAADMCRRYSPSLLRRILKLDPGRLNSPANKKPARTHHQPPTAFFTLPPNAALPELGSAAPHSATACRLQLERPDGSRLTFVLPACDPSTITALCSHFLRS